MDNRSTEMEPCSIDMYHDADLERVAAILAIGVVAMLASQTEADATSLNDAPIPKSPACDEDILALLMGSGPKAPVEIAEALDLNRSTVSRSLNRLLLAARIEAHGNTKSRFYEASRIPTAIKAA